MSKKVRVLVSPPHIGNGDTWGGFGDVAANLWVALQLARRNPQLSLEICPVVRDRRNQPISSDFAGGLVFRLSEIIAAMLVGIDRSTLPQNLELPGIPSGLGSGKSPSRRENDSGLADWAVSFSRNQCDLALEAASVAKFVYLVEEPGRNEAHLVRTVKSPRQASVICLNGGSHGLGYYVEPKPINPLLSAASRTACVRDLSAMAGVALSPNHQFAFVYPGREYSVDPYLNLYLSVARRTRRPTVIIVVGRTGEACTKASEGTHIIHLPSLPFTTFNRFIWLCDLPPTITGDVSLSHALDSSAVGRGFLYSSPSWKTFAVRALRSDLQTSAASVVTPEHYRKGLDISLTAVPDRFQVPEERERLVSLLLDAAFQSWFAGLVGANLRRLSIVKNLEILMRWSLDMNSQSAVLEQLRKPRLVAALTDSLDYGDFRARVKVNRTGFAGGPRV